MTKNSKNIYIIGAGISGLITALELEKANFKPTIIEATNGVGGRVKTDTVDGFQLDQGFQVLLEAYPKVKQFLDYKALELQTLLPGAVIFKNGTPTTIGDPLRAISLFIPTLTSNIGSVKDKLTIFKLNLELKNKSIEAIFNAEQTTTLHYLKAKGFSDRIINNFFKPFFSGIFLETELRTSSVMFQFVYKMFGEGLAVIPKNGIQAIPNQLQSKLKNTTFKFNTKVKAVEENRIILEDGSVIETDAIVIATEASKLLNLKQEMNWKSCDNLYFEVERNTLKKPIIGLIADEKAIINNIFSLQVLKQKNSITNNHLLSVTVVKQHHLNETELIQKVISELKTYCNITTKRFIKRYEIKQALPDLKLVRYTKDYLKYKHSDSIYLTGDTELNGSLNAAMSSGEAVAKQIIEDFK